MSVSPVDIAISCSDGVIIRGHLWRNSAGRREGTVIVNPATGVLARYYHHFARFLAEQGFAAITYDYRGIGASRPASLRNSGIRWRDWGELDFEATIQWALRNELDRPLNLVGHSIGGFLLGFAPSAVLLDRILTMGAQYAYFRDYAESRRASMLFKWHFAMPILTALFGYFPGRRLGWLEDLPSGVANEWSFRRAAMELSYPPHEREALRGRFATLRTPILAVGLTDDIFGTRAAIARALRYYRGSDSCQVEIRPSDLGFDSIGHFGLFHERHRDGFWRSALAWLRGGANPWPHAEVPPR